MIRFLMQWALNLVVAALGLLAAAAIVPGVTLQGTGFVVAVVVVAFAQAILTPLGGALARKYATAVQGGVGLAATFFALWVATLFPGGLEISGISAWISGTVVVWLCTMLGGWLLTWLVLTRWWDRRQQSQ